MKISETSIGGFAKAQLFIEFYCLLAGILIVSWFLRSVKLIFEGFLTICRPLLDIYQ